MIAEDIYNFLDSAVPFSSAAEWDNTGLSVGSLNKEIKTVLISLDVTNEAIDYAQKIGADLVLTHHPLIFDSVKQIKEDTPLYNAVKSGMTFISSHTCLDKADCGVNTVLAEKTGIKNLYQSDADEFLKIGEIELQTAEQFAANVKNALGGTVSFTNPEKLIKKVAVCSGSGGDLVFAAAQEGADALLTGEAKHHELLASNDLGVSLIVSGHYETENIICGKLMALLTEKFSELKIEVFEKNPAKYI